MTDKQIETRIAESLGWVNIQSEQFTGTLKGYPPKRHTYEYVPHYTNDLNAMHEAEKASFRGSTLWEAFVFNLMESTGGIGLGELDGLCCVVQATARQRAEAFLRTLNLWEDGE